MLRFVLSHYTECTLRNNKGDNMSAEKIIRLQSREKLKNCGWSKALIGVGIIAVFYMIFDCFMSFQSVFIDYFKLNETLLFIYRVSFNCVLIIISFLLSPVILGYLKMMYSDKEEYDINDLLYFFTNFKIYSKAVAFVFSYFVRLIIPAILFFIPPILLFLIHNFWFKGAISDNVDKALMCTLIIASTLQLIRYSIKYFVSVLLLIENEDANLSYYFKTSSAIMRTHEKDVMRLFLSFTWWILLCITVLPALYVIPYMTQAMCISGKWITQLSRNGQNNELF